MKKYSSVAVVLVLVGSVVLGACSTTRQSTVPAQPAMTTTLEATDTQNAIETTGTTSTTDIDQAIEELDSVATQKSPDVFSDQEFSESLGE